MEPNGGQAIGTAAEMTDKRGSAFHMERMRLMAWRPSTSFAIMLASVSINLVAFALSIRIPSGDSEANPFVHPGMLASLGFSEGTIVLGSFMLSKLIRDEAKRCVILAAMAGLLTGDALNDIVISLTNNQFLAVDISYTFTALVPAFVAMKWLQSQLS
jgi:hypothetical protein